MKILITGANGYVGRQLIESLVSSNPSVEITALIHQRKNNLSNKVSHVITEDLTNLTIDSFDNQPFDTVIHLAALLPDRANARGDYVRVNVEGTKKLIDSLTLSNIRQFILISTVAVYGSAIGRLASETDKDARHLSLYASTKLQSEKICESLCQRNGFHFTILRLGLLYGEGMTYGWQSVINSISRNGMKLIGSAQRKIQLTYIHDATKGISLAVSNKKAYGRIINISGQDVRPISEVFNIIADKMGAARPKSVPFLPVYITSYLLLLLPNGWLPETLRYLTPERVRFFRYDHIYSTTVASAALNFVPRFNLEHGLDKMVKAYRKKFCPQS